MLDELAFSLLAFSRMRLSDIVAIAATTMIPIEANRHCLRMVSTLRHFSAVSLDEGKEQFNA